MVVVTFVIELKYRASTLETVAYDQPCFFELGEDAVYRGQTDIFLQFQQLLVDILGAHMPYRGVLQDLENFQAWHGRPEAGLF